MEPGKLFVPTDEERKQVIEWAGLGVTIEDMAALLRDDGIDADTCAKHFKREIRRGKALAHVKMGDNLFQRGLNSVSDSPAIFYAKTQMGWKETQVTELHGKDGESLNPINILINGA